MIDQGIDGADHSGRVGYLNPFISMIIKGINRVDRSGRLGCMGSFICGFSDQNGHASARAAKASGATASTELMASC